MAILSIKTDESLGVQTDTANELSDGTAPGAIVLNNGEIFPLLFDAALATLTTATGQVNNPAVSLSGFSAATPNGTTVDIAGLNATAKVQDIGFTAFNGVLAIDQNGDPLKTTDGHYIYLYTYASDNNVLLGREGGSSLGADPNGALVFAAYIDTLLADGVTSADTSTKDVGATSAKVWMVQYQPLHNLNPNDPNDVLTLGNDLGVFVNSLQNFSLEGAPSGQNLFLMFGDGTPAAGETAIIVTGKHPINQSDPNAGSLTSGDTVNTGQGGGMTTIGSNNQMIDPNEGMYFSFVTLGADSPGVTVPNLDQNEADVEANMKFDSFLGATEASFAVVQLQPPKGATLKVTAINNTDSTEKGALFIDGLSDGSTADSHGSNDDLQVNITQVTISRDVKVGKTVVHQTYTFSGATDHPAAQNGLTLDFTGNTVTITGVIAGDNIDYTTATNHNRVLIDNIGNANANLNSAFDIGAFKLASGSLTPSNLGALGFVDSAPTAAATLGTGSVTNDETAGLQAAPANDTTDATVAALFAGVTTPSTQLTTVAYAQGSAAVIDSSTSVFGADGPAAANSKVYSLAVAAAGVDSGAQTDDGTHIMLFKEGDLVVGRIGSAARAAAFAVAIDASTGVLSMAQYSAIKHPDGTNANDSKSIDDSALQAVVTVTDGDGDQSTASVNIGNEVKILDDGPAITADITGAPQPMVDESNFAVNDSDSFAAQFSPVYGADGQGATPVTYGLSTGGGDSGLVDTATGSAIYLFSQSGNVVGRVGNNPAGAVVFVVGVDGTGNVSLDQSRAIVHTPDTGPDQSLSMLGTGKVVLTATAHDGDGDSASAQLDITAQLVFKDDGPAIGPISDSIVDFVAYPGAGSSATQSLLGGVGADVKTSPYTIIDFTAALSTTGLPTLHGLASAGNTVVSYWADTGGNGTYGDAGDTKYYELSLNQTDNSGAGSYTFKVLVAPPPTEIAFGFDLLPSGQNLFGIVGTTTTGLVVIGKSPVLNADGTFTNTSNTINTSQGGGSVTIGVSNQMFDAGEGAYFTLVNNPVANYLSGAVGGLDQNEADDADNIQYTGGTKEVTTSFTKISQIQGNSLATMKVTAIDMTGAPQGRDFVLTGDGTGLGQGTVRDILSVQVFNAAGVKVEDTADLAHFNSASVSVDLSGLTAIVSGLDAGYKIQWVTSGVHDQVLIEDVAGKFDIGAFGTNQPNPIPDQVLSFTAQVTDGDGDQAQDVFLVGIDGTGIYDNGMVVFP